MQIRPPLRLALIAGALLSAVVTVTCAARRNPAPSAQAKLLRFLHATYRDFDATPGERAAASTSICAERLVQIDAQPHVLLAACRYEGGGRRGAIRSLDLYLLKLGRDNEPTVIAKSERAEPADSLGRLPEVEVVQLGDALYGFRTHRSSMVSGRIVAGTVLYAPAPRGIVPVLNLVLAQDNAGSAVCSAEPLQCRQLRRQLTIDASRPASVYQLLVDEQVDDDAGGQRRHVTLQFDPRLWRYQPPRDFDPAPPDLP